MGWGLAVKLYFGDKELSARSARRPRFKHGHRGRTWDTVTATLDGSRIVLYYDSTFGNFFYFSLDQRRWWKLPIARGDLLDGAPKLSTIPPSRVLSS
jgi:hypothetical protein